MPKLIFDSKDLIPEGLGEGATELEDGKFEVKVVLQSKLDEFRNTNIEKSKELDSTKAALDQYVSVYGEVSDFDEAKTSYLDLQETKQKVDDGKIKESSDIEAELNKRTATMRKDHEEALKAEATARAAAEARADASDNKYRRSVIDSHVTAAAIAKDSGVEPTALADLLVRAQSVFKVNEEGAVVAMKGENIIYGADGATPMTPTEWIGGLKEDAPHFFKRSGGGDAGGNDKEKDSVRQGMSDKDWAKVPGKLKLQMARERENAA